MSLVKKLLISLGTAIIAIAGTYITTRFVSDEDFYIRGNENLDREIDLARSRANNGDSFPQTLSYFISFIEEYKSNGGQIRVHARKTYPKWEWTVFEG